jgi:hypothetical protein
MKPLTKFKTTTPLVIPLALACFALLPRAQAETPAALPSPPPDGAYTGFNTAEGLNALLSLTTGQFNTALAFAALKADTTGGSNTAVGGQALLHNPLGSYNTAVGENAMTFNTTGSFNMALGQGVLASNNADGTRPWDFKRSITTQPAHRTRPSALVRRLAAITRLTVLMRSSST